MSLTESDAWQVPAGMPEPGSLGDRTPPQDMAAEQSVLGGMLLSKDAIADVLEKLRARDFYRPTHQHIYDAILHLYGRGEPADAVTVAAELDRRGLLVRIGAAPYLHTLISMVPTAANAGYYAGIVAEKALLRRLVAAGINQPFARCAVSRSIRTVRPIAPAREGIDMTSAQDVTVTDLSTAERLSEALAEVFRTA